MISIKNVVTVDFDIVKDSDVLGDFETTVYFAPISMTDDQGNSTNMLLITNPIQIDNQLTGNQAVITSAKYYFSNGGEKLLIINPTTYSLEAFEETIENAKNIVNDFMYICISNQLMNENAYTAELIKNIADFCDATVAPDKIRLLLTTNSGTFIENYGLTENYVGVKFTSKTVDSNLVDAALLIGAYFSSVNLDDADSVKDYCYTKESMPVYGTVNGQTVLVDDGSENATQETFDALIKNEDNQGYYNFIDKIGNSIVNFGGNLATVDGVAIHTDFGANAVERDISYSVLEKMIGKQYLTEQGMSNIKAAINSNLQRYKTNGYLNVGAQYSGETLEIPYNGNKYLVIEAGTLLPQGFYIYSIPMQDISATDRQAKRFTPLYVILETQSGARVIEIKGEIRA